jgi:hypothetical protein
LFIVKSAQAIFIPKNVLDNNNAADAITTKTVRISKQEIARLFINQTLLLCHINKK